MIIIIIIMSKDDFLGGLLCQTKLNLLNDNTRYLKNYNKEDTKIRSI